MNLIWQHSERTEETRTLESRSALRSSLDKDFVSIHPEQQQPLDSQNHEGVEKRLQVPRGSCPGARKDAHHGMQTHKAGKHVNENRVAANYDEGQRPLPVAANVHGPVEQEKHEAGPSCRHQ